MILVEKPRFKDTGKQIYDFLDCVLVECSRFHRCAKITGNPGKTNPKFVCEKCGVTGLIRGDVGDSTYGYYINGVRIGNSNYYGGCNLWLKTPCCGNTLWAYNKEHLDFLESYVSATLREKVPNKNKSLVSRLPSWIKSAKNRESVLNGIRKLRHRLNSQ